MSTMDRILKGETVDTEKDELGKVWICKKCHLIRSSKVTHQHGVPLQDFLLTSISEYEKEKAKAVH